MRWIALLLLALPLAGCADETQVDGAPLGWGPASGSLYTPPASGGGIVGDWLYCGDPDCAEVGSSGLRFAADGTWASLRGYLWDENGDVTYCLGYDEGTYAFSGTSLTLTFGQGYSLTCNMALSGDRATLACGELYSGVLQRFDAGEAPLCPFYDDVPAGG